MGRSEDWLGASKKFSECSGPASEYSKEVRVESPSSALEKFIELEAKFLVVAIFFVGQTGDHGSLSEN